MKRFLMGLILTSSIGIIGGCGVTSAHYKYDREAFELVGPLADKELTDQEEALKQAFADGKISEKDFNEKLQSIKFKKIGIEAWGKVTKDNLGEAAE